MVAKKTHPQSDLPELARLIRSWLIRMTTAAGSDHLSSSLSSVEAMVGLMFGGWFKADMKQPHAPNNDRLIFSKGHAAPLLYALYAAAGRVSPNELLTLRAFTGRLEGHPSPRFPYTEVPTGSLGQGLSVALGEAIAAQIDHLPYRTFCLLGDSEMAEGSVWEAIQLAGYRRQGNLTAIVDFNGLGQSGPTMYGHNPLVLARRVQSFGWRTAIVHGHNLAELEQTYAHVSKIQTQPVMVIARTIKGYGVAAMQGKPDWHGKVLSPRQAEVALKDLGPVSRSLRGTVARPTKKLPNVSAKQRPREVSYRRGDLISPRQAIGSALVRLAPKYPNLVVIDGEVKNSTYTESFEQKHARRFVEGYIAEQNAVGMATGLARRGKLPVMATFGAFYTRAYDQLRMASYSSTSQVYVGTHPGVHIGPDGMSQMALQDIALFRTLEKSVVLYPADAVSAERLLEIGLKTPGITYLRVTRAEVPVIYSASMSFVVGGSHTLCASPRDQATIVAAGITIQEAMTAAHALARRSIRVRVVDLYSIKPIDVATLKKAAAETKHLIVVEDHYSEGGIAEAVRGALGKEAGCVTSLAVRKTPRSGTPGELLAYEGIDAKAIQTAVQRLIR